MSQPPDNTPEAETQQLPAVEQKSSNTRTILEIVGAVVAVAAIFIAGALGFAAGWLAGSHDKRHDDIPRMTMRYDGGGQNDRGGEAVPGIPGFPGFGQGGPDGNGEWNPFGNGDGGAQQLPELPDDLEQWLEQFGEQLREGLEGGQDSAPAPDAPVPSTAPNS